ncbi:hypothetical protein [Pontibacter burrus]|uniref:Uncharacterized protein n=1 Tax=Pontibacter burrus TaxID=2704466 RepID=A0A6B3LWC7_9BACT|nr:hypothetical protein [Pontibacter burrus]NEM97890.1 hypothetical protein [Pontibacter burrus]
MKRHYNIIAGLAMIMAVMAGAYFNNNEFYYKQKRVSKIDYEYNSGDSDYYMKWKFNLGAAIAGGLATAGVGLLTIGVISRKQKTS